MSGLEALVGATVTAIFMSEDRLIFQTDRRLIAYGVEADCCSESYFFDFYGVRHVLDNGPVVAFESVQLSPGDVGYRPSTWDPEIVRREYQDVVEVYGYRITTEHPQFGPVSSVFSFRNDSNGYYGGWMSLVSDCDQVPEDAKPLTEDFIGGAS